jgi:hypothetical protein
MIPYFPFKGLGVKQKNLPREREEKTKKIITYYNACQPDVTSRRPQLTLPGY